MVIKFNLYFDCKVIEFPAINSFYKIEKES